MTITSKCAQITTMIPVPFAQLPQVDADALADLYRRGTPDNTQRAWERDLAYIAAWKQLSQAACKESDRECPSRRPQSGSAAPIPK